MGAKNNLPELAMEDFLKAKVAPEEKAPEAPKPHVSLNVNVQVTAPQKAPAPVAPVKRAAPTKVVTVEEEDPADKAHDKLLNSWAPAKGKLTVAQIEARAAWAKRMGKLGETNK